ncbi:MAG: hypothetical protein SLAVMIC_00696 [uncultured marine phage]|uniref:Uncharacterized protein n=1 Tax=uncultured marine phage TaxID=707152 RepID=A0A8D9CFK8_9VIRU|nr:MAG: hypothetical protein SLAVMIC_00696 [uncultured marine phage]
MEKRKEIITERGEVLQVRYVVERDLYGDKKFICRLYKKQKNFLFSYHKKVGGWQRGAGGYNCLNTLPIDLVKEFTEDCIGYYYENMDNSDEFEKWDGFMGDEEQRKNFVREVRLKKLLNDE